MFVDSHEQPNIVKDWNQFLIKIKKIEVIYGQIW